MFRNLLLTVVTGVGLMATTAAAPAAQPHPYHRDRDDYHGRRDRDHDRDFHRDYYRGTNVVVALADPGALTGFRGQNGQSFTFEVTGNINAGSVWGSGPYTDDSMLAAAAVHAGVLADGQTGLVKVTILPGAGGYGGSDRNGVASGDWGAWDGSYQIER